MPLQGFTGIVGTSWSKPARWRTKRADQVLIAMHQLDHDSAHLFSTRLNSVFKFSADTPCGSARFTITTTSNLHCLMQCWRNASLMILFTRFRSTAPDSVFLPTIIPSRAFFWPLGTKKILMCLSDMLSARTTWSKPFSRNNRCAAVNLADGLDCETATSNREFGTAPSATCIDHRASAARFHAHQEAMGAFSLDYGWLVCTFHVFPRTNRKTRHYKAFWRACQAYFTLLLVDKFQLAL